MERQWHGMASQHLHSTFLHCLHTSTVVLSCRGLERVVLEAGRIDLESTRHRNFAARHLLCSSHHASALDHVVFIYLQSIKRLQT